MAADHSNVENLQAQVGTLTVVAGILLGEIAKLSPNPDSKLDAMRTNLLVLAEGAARAGGSPLGTKVLEGIVSIAEALVTDSQRPR